ncbi:MAG TPA: hypothetical protein VGM83_05160 [Devosiaceae bacterium]|jgi:hypothetical protein
MPNNDHKHGSTHDQHVKAGQQSDRNNTSGDNVNNVNEDRNVSDGSTRGGTHEQHVKAGQQSHKNS